MIVNESVITGRYYRVLIDKATKLWQRISYWTHSTDVEFEDGKNAEEKLGGINGITSDVELENEDIAASIKAVNQLNNNLVEKINEMKESFQAGVDAIYNKIKSLGTTPGGKDLDSILAAIQKLYASGAWELVLKVQARVVPGTSQGDNVVVVSLLTLRYNPTTKSVYRYNIQQILLDGHEATTAQDDPAGSTTTSGITGIHVNARRNACPRTSGWHTDHGDATVEVYSFRFL